MTDTKERMQGMIADVQRFSTEDGPGIRTTVFFKGCNLRCAWCHNPETQNFTPELLFYENKCTACGACKKACPYALEKCTACGACTEVCPNDARQISGKAYTVDELLKELKKDELFYQTSGGGVTFSGGECMLQIDFLEQMLRRCKDAGLSTAVDTAGEVSFERFERILPFTDLFLYDIKAADSDTHKKYVGVDNALIFANLKKLQEKGARIWIRIPIIEGVNATVAEMQKINALLKASGGIERVELLPYHKLGGNKYKALGRTPQVFSAPSKEQMQSLVAVFEFPASVR